MGRETGQVLTSLRNVIVLYEVSGRLASGHGGPPEHSILQVQGDWLRPIFGDLPPTGYHLPGFL